jgi:hypothetical protein
LQCFERLPWQLWRSRNTQRHSTPLSASVTRKTVNPYYSWRFVTKARENGLVDLVHPVSFVQPKTRQTR